MLKKLTRRRFILGALAAGAGLVPAHAFAWEPSWLRIRRVRLTRERPAHRFVHFTDLHYKGDAAFLKSVVKAINRCAPDFVCFTGDLIEEAEHLPGVLEHLRGIKAPLYGVPGNHDYWSHADFDVIAEAFAGTGGAWMMDSDAILDGGRIHLIGITCQQPPVFEVKPGMRNILLLHYPEWADKIGPQKLDLLLAGHSHGGQVRLPFVGALMVPYGVGRYDLGMFQTPAGRLYVNPGIGYFYLRVRFRCRPEITIFEL